MVVQHNITGMNANRMLNITTKSQAKSTEKLSSGYKINRAADDAAGLSISEKMRKQIRGLTQASLNAQDGISAVQTAEGALTEVHDMLQRMNELAVKASNGTMSADDRQAVQDEIDQLVTEIDRVSTTTKFNEIYLLKGEGTTETTTKVETAPMTAEYKNAPTTSIAAKTSDATATAKEFYEAGSTTKLTQGALAALMEVKSDGTVGLMEGKAVYTVAAATGTEYGAQTDDKLAALADLQAEVKVTSTALYDSVSKNEVKAEDLKNYFNDDGTYKGNLSAWKADGTDIVEVGADRITEFVTVTARTTTDKTDESANPLQFNLHVGSESALDNKIGVEIKAMSAKGIGVDGLKGEGVKTESDATEAIKTISEAISAVSKQRSALGAIQNRLEHTINNLDNIVENTTSAESAIRDTDMATEMVKYSNNNILAQAGQAMLAQANQVNQGVLSLLG